MCRTELEKERATYGDLLQGDFIDAYTNNTHKLNTALRYVTEHCINNTDYVLLIDGDYSLNIRNLELFLTKLGSATDVYGGDVWSQSRPFRLPLHKHYVSLQEYPYTYYPDYVTAGAILLSQDVAKKFYITSLYTKYYPFDDVYYGFIALKLGITPISLSKLLPSHYSIPKASDPANKNLIGSHRFGNIQEVEYIYNNFGS